MESSNGKMQISAEALYSNNTESNAKGILFALASVAVAIILLVIIVMNFSYYMHPASTESSFDEAVQTEEPQDMQVSETDEIQEEMILPQEQLSEGESVSAETGEAGAIEETGETEETGEAEAEISSYIIPDSDTRLISEADLAGLSEEEIRIARNEIYARHGRMFNDEGLQEYFNSREWYRGTVSPEDFTQVMLNDIERQNTDIINAYEARMGYNQ